MKKTIAFITVLSMLSLIFAVAAPAGPAMDRIIKKGELVVGTTGTQPPISATTKTGELMGLDADIAKAMAEAMTVDIKFAVMPFAELLPALKAGRVDMVLSSMTITPDRNQQVAFIGPYYVSGKGILALAENFTALKEAQGLNAPDVTVAALKSSTSQAFVEELLPLAQRKLTGSYDEALEMLFSGKVDIIVADYPFCALTAYRFQEKGLIAGGSPLSYEPLGIALPEDTLLINWVRNFLVTLQGSGRLKKMTNKWLQGGTWVEQLP